MLDAADDTAIIDARLTRLAARQVHINQRPGPVRQHLELETELESNCFRHSVVAKPRAAWWVVGENAAALLFSHTLIDHSTVLC